jgi:hypothetical protein
MWNIFICVILKVWSSFVLILYIITSLCIVLLILKLNVMQTHIILYCDIPLTPPTHTIALTHSHIQSHTKCVTLTFPHTLSASVSHTLALLLSYHSVSCSFTHMRFHTLTHNTPRRTHAHITLTHCLTHTHRHMHSHVHTHLLGDGN